MTVGTDTYLTVADADTYVNQNYVFADAKRTAWEALTSGDKEIYLRKAASVIDRQPLRGMKANLSQLMQFPRALYTDYNRRDFPILNTHFYSDWLVQTEVPPAVKSAQVEIALEMANGVSGRVQMQREGVTSYSIGNLSETFGKSAESKIASFEAYQLLKPFLAGTVSI